MMDDGSIDVDVMVCVWPCRVAAIDELRSTVQYGYGTIQVRPTLNSVSVLSTRVRSIPVGYWPVLSTQYSVLSRLPVRQVLVQYLLFSVDTEFETAVRTSTESTRYTSTRSLLG